MFVYTIGVSYRCRGVKELKGYTDNKPENPRLRTILDAGALLNVQTAGCEPIIIPHELLFSMVCIQEAHEEVLRALPV